MSARKWDGYDVFVWSLLSTPVVAVGTFCAGEMLGVAWLSLGALCVLIGAGAVLVLLILGVICGL